MVKDFITQADIKRNDYLLKTEELFVINKNSWFADFTRYFQSISEQICKAQDNSELPVVAYLEYTMLYSNFVNRKYVADIFVYNKESYIDKNQRLIGSYDISFLFVCFDELWDKLLTERKRYVGKVTALDVTTYMLGALPDFFSYLISLARFALVECIDESPLADIRKDDSFYVNVGNYMVNTEPVYTEKKNQDVKLLLALFEERSENGYAFDDYTGLDFSGRSIVNTQLSYSQFRRACLNSTSLEGSALIGSNFTGASMDHCCFDNCFIYEADFSSAILRNSSFTNACGQAGLTDTTKWAHVGFIPVSFRNADLTNVDFSNANLTGADFTGAILNGASFTGAIIDGASGISFFK